MIISCDQCHKKFEIDSNLIPKDGRLLECGSCNHKWFYKQDIEDKTEEIIIEPQLKNIEEENIDPIQTNISQINELDTSSEKKKIVENKKIKKISILNIIIVFIISFVALIILIETFKDPISIFIPNIKFMLNSLYEILKDIILFFNDLIK
tara:strand:- start:286 stop:738 length:453 start_codon:yes stop_codon:yes gene_type:complete